MCLHILIINIYWRNMKLFIDQALKAKGLKSAMNFKLLKPLVYSAMFAVLTLSFTGNALAAEQPVNDVPRGKLLYSLHCISCHNEQVHWQAHKKVTNWPSLIAQVKLWQGVANLKWNDSDIESVAKHLNTLYYHYPVPDTLAHKK